MIVCSRVTLHLFASLNNASETLVMAQFYLLRLSGHGKTSPTPHEQNRRKRLPTASLTVGLVCLDLHRLEQKITLYPRLPSNSWLPSGLSTPKYWDCRHESLLALLSVIFSNCTQSIMLIEKSPILWEFQSHGEKQLHCEGCEAPGSCHTCLKCHEFSFLSFLSVLLFGVMRVSHMRVR